MYYYVGVPYFVSVVIEWTMTWWHLYKMCPVPESFYGWRHYYNRLLKCFLAIWFWCRLLLTILVLGSMPLTSLVYSFSYFSKLYDEFSVALQLSFIAFSHFGFQFHIHWHLAIWRFCLFDLYFIIFFILVCICILFVLVCKSLQFWVFYFYVH